MMKVTEIAFSKHLGIIESESGLLCLPFDDHLQNHLGTMHAAALYALAETACGAYLQELFPELAQKVVAVLRSAQAKYKNPATETVFGHASVDQSVVEPFRERIRGKGRALIEIKVELKNAKGQIAFIGNYGWFVTNLPGSK